MGAAGIKTPRAVAPGFALPVGDQAGARRRARYVLGLLLFAADKVFVSIRGASRYSRVGSLLLFPSAGRVGLADWRRLCLFQIPAYFANSDDKPDDGSSAGPIFNHGRNMVKGSLTVQHHHDRGPDNDFDDPGGWNRASYQSHPVDSMEPLSDEPNSYRAAALHHMQLMYAVDEFLTAAEDSRLAVVAVAVAFNWPSARGLTLGNIADQLGCSLSTLTRSIAQIVGRALGVSAGGIRPGAGSNGDKPAAVRA